MFDTIREIGQLVVASTGISSRLGSMLVKIGCTREPMKDTDQEENVNAGKDYVRRRECL